MTPDDIKKMLEFALGYIVKYIPAWAQPMVKTAIDQVLPGVISQLMGPLTPADIISKGFDLLLLGMTGHPFAKLALESVKNVLIKQIQVILAAHASEGQFFRAEPVTITIYPEG